MEGSCRKGHDLSIAGKAVNRQCRQCRRNTQARYQATPKGRDVHHRYNRTEKGRAITHNYKATVGGQLTEARGIVRRRLQRKITRLAELEGVSLANT
jgi:hypothetical protein